MRYSDWVPIYKGILKDFGFDGAKDDEAAKLASEILSHKLKAEEKTITQEVEKLIKGKRVIICGNAPCLEREIRDREKEFDVSPFSHDCVVIAADGATSVLLRNAIIPDLVCTDLDGIIADIITANRLGSIIVVHAHGDNMAMLKKVLPALNENVLCTTQSKPLHNVHNFGGFTDGDRCVFLAKEFGACEIELLGFDFEDEQVSERKKKKLKWAKRLISDVL
ncbi:MAG: 6-hydroxymethylpterin diphosphokinase MptE-like protein [Euryarchaeota archaeon]|nr:6-hydroxymethylpterin diphosphokinase MptE-like protein [Euryarchaeota archaeon]